MSPSAVLLVARQERRSVMVGIATTGPSGKCSPWCVLSVARTPRYLLNPAVIGQCTVAIAFVKTDRADNILARFRVYAGWK